MSRARQSGRMPDSLFYIGRVQYSEYIAAVETNGAALADAFGAGPLDAAVPTCPGWQVRDLAAHLWDFTGFWTHVVCEGTGRPKTPFAPRPDTPEALARGYRDLVGHLRDELAAATADTVTWSWSPHEQHAGWVARRTANELAVHRVDAELARGSHQPLDAAHAADIIDEIFTSIVPSGTGNGETLHAHGTDRPDEWMITIGRDGVHMEHAHGKGDLALRGAVSDLALTLYGRPPVGSIERFGDDSVLDVWRTAFTF